MYSTMFVSPFAPVVPYCVGKNRTGPMVLVHHFPLFWVLVHHFTLQLGLFHFGIRRGRHSLFLAQLLELSP